MHIYIYIYISIYAYIYIYIYIYIGHYNDKYPIGKSLLTKPVFTASQAALPPRRDPPGEALLAQGLSGCQRGTAAAQQHEAASVVGAAFAHGFQNLLVLATWLGWE